MRGRDWPNPEDRHSPAYPSLHIHAAGASLRSAPLRVAASSVHSLFCWLSCSQLEANALHNNSLPTVKMPTTTTTTRTGQDHKKMTRERQTKTEPKAWVTTTRQKPSLLGNSIAPNSECLPFLSIPCCAILLHENQ